jgi:hypothetical protein
MGHTTGQAVCRLASQESPRLQYEKTGSARRAGWRLHQGELELGDEDKASQWLSSQK